MIIDLAFHTLHNPRRSISDHMYNVGNTHDNNAPDFKYRTPSEDTDQVWHPPKGTRAFAAHMEKFSPRISNESKAIILIILLLSDECTG